MTNASLDRDRTAPSATPLETPPMLDERYRATTTVVRAPREVQMVENCGSSAKADGLILGLPSWRTIKDRLPSAGYERSAVIRWTLSPNGWLCVEAIPTPADVVDGLEQADRSNARKGRDFREGELQ